MQKGEVMKNTTKAIALLLCLVCLFCGVRCTTDTVAPSISDVSASVTSSSATITWTTDEKATSKVEYGATSSYGESSLLDSSLVTSHSVDLSFLSAGTYHYRVISKDAAGNEAKSGDFTFTVCDIMAPIVSNVAASEITQTSAKITWTTDDPSTSQVEYGPTSDFGMTSALDTNLVTSHSVTLTGLIQGTYYYYKVKSKDACGQEGSSITWDNFITPAQQNLSVGQATQNAVQKVTVKSAVKVDHYEWGSGYQDYASSGNTYLIVDAEVENIGTESFFAFIGNFTVSDSSDYKYEYALYLAGDEFDSVTLYTGQKTSGKILFEVPTTATGLKLAYDLGNVLSGPILATWVLAV
ncbi:MAG: DUF4352 domain-containing protein [Methanothrix sp.]|nr:DUF4352 domain-containing protein [Methanothrix sp.]